MVTKAQRARRRRNRNRRRNKGNQNVRRRPKGMTPTYGQPLAKLNKQAVRTAAQAVCSNVNPFCKAANGARQFAPGTSSNTLALQCRYSGVFNLPAGGAQVIEFEGRLRNTLRYSATFSGSEVATWNSWVDMPEYAELNALDAYYRVVSFGVHVYCSAASNESQGSVVFLTSNSQNTVDYASDQYMDVSRRSLAGLDAYWISKADDDKSDFKDVGGNTISPYQSLAVGIYGGNASTTVASYEVVMNIEWYPRTLTIFYRMSRIRPQSNPQIEAAVANTSSFIENVYSYIPDAEVMKHATKHLLGAAAGYLTGGPAGAANYAASAMIMDVD